MSSADGPDGAKEIAHGEPPQVDRQSVELQLFDSLVHHLIEKGLLTRNDALSVVQSVAEVELGAIEEVPERRATGRLSTLERLFASYQMLPERQPARPVEADGNIVQLRAPLHQNHPEFPRDH